MKSIKNFLKCLLSFSTLIFVLIITLFAIGIKYLVAWISCKLTSEFYSDALLVIITIIFLPIIVYLTKRKINQCLIEVYPYSPKIIDENGNFRGLDLKVKNNSFATLNNVAVFVNFNLRAHKSLMVYTTESFDTYIKNSEAILDYATLSWCRNIDGKNLPRIDINQGEVCDFNFIRVHDAIATADYSLGILIHNKSESDSIKKKNKKVIRVIQIAAENGFGNKDESDPSNSIVSRVLMESKDLEFEIIITANDMVPIKKKVKYCSTPENDETLRII